MRLALLFGSLTLAFLLVAFVLARQITGSYSGIMGLPAFETAQVLQAAGLRLL